MSIHNITILAERTHPQFEDAMVQWAAFIRDFLRLKTTDEFLIEDVIQETLIKVLKNIEKFKPREDSDKDGSKAWVKRIALNTLIDIGRKGRREFLQDDGAMSNAHDNSDLQLSGEERHYENIEDVNAVRYALECRKRFHFTKRCSHHFNDLERIIFMLAFNAGMKNFEIAGKLDITVKEVRNKRDYSLKKVKKCISVQWQTLSCQLYKSFKNCQQECPYAVKSKKQIPSLKKQLGLRNDCRNAREGGSGPCEQKR